MTREPCTVVLIGACLLLLPVAGCVQHNVRSDPIEIKPIHITMDVNLRVQRELDEFFDFEERESDPATPTEIPKE